MTTGRSMKPLDLNIRLDPSVKLILSTKNTIVYIFNMRPFVPNREGRELIHFQVEGRFVILLDTGRKRTEACGVDNVFPADDLKLGPDTGHS